MPETRQANGKWLYKRNPCRNAWQSTYVIAPKNPVRKHTNIKDEECSKLTLPRKITPIRFFYQMCELNRFQTQHAISWFFLGQMMSDCGRKSRCIQRYTFQHLLAVDPDNLHDCPTIRAFKFPAACVCHIEFPDYHSEFFWTKKNKFRVVIVTLSVYLYRYILPVNCFISSVT